MSRAAAVTFKGNPLTLAGEAVKVGQSAPDFTLHYYKDGMQTLTPANLKGKPTIISVVPSLDTPVCEAQTHLPFAQGRFCGAEGISNMQTASDYQNRSFGNNWGMLIEELKLLARGVFVLDADGKVTYAETVPEVTSEPNYEAALSALKSQL